MKNLIYAVVLVGFGLAVGFWLGRGTPSEAATAAAKNRVFELRTYYTNEGKLPDLEKRFRDHTTRIFQKHGMTNIGYWVPQDEPKSQNTLIYIISHESRDAAKKNWDDFRNDPEWKKVAAESEVNGKIVSKVESVYMNPTDYSPIK
ncbi:MAG: NIPSNAP family protein [Blastocatellia bacterium]